MAAAIGTRRIGIDGVNVLVREAGPPDARDAIVFVHGNPGSGADFAALMAKLGETRRVLAPDMPGYGKSDRPAGFDYTVQGYADFLGRILDETGVERAHLVLHDFGGPWGLTWAASHPGRAASLVLLNIGLMPGYRWHKFARIWRTPVLGELNMALMTRATFRMLLNADNPKPFPAEFIDRMYGDMDWPMKRAVLKLYRSASNPGEMHKQLAAAFEDRKIPVLVIWGEGDRYVPVRFAQEQKEFFDAEVHILPQAGHWPMIDEPEEVERLAVTFFERIAA